MNMNLSLPRIFVLRRKSNHPCLSFPPVDLASSPMKVLLVTIKVSVYIVPQGCCAVLVGVFIVIAGWDYGLLPFFGSLHAAF